MIYSIDLIVSITTIVKLSSSIVLLTDFVILIVTEAFLSHAAIVMKFLTTFLITSTIIINFLQFITSSYRYHE